MSLSHDIGTCVLGNQPKVWRSTVAGRLLFTITDQALVSKGKMQPCSVYNLQLSWLVGVAFTHRCNALC